jgi:hypothetical protein
MDFADAHRALAHQVCVAAGAACGATATYVGSASADLTMRDGIGVLGNYESTTWTRCSSSVTTLQPKTARGIVFPSNIALTTALDGFTVVYGFDASAAATGVTVDGARGAVLSNLVVSGPTSPYVVITGEGIGVDVSHGASATIAQSSIQAHVSAGYTAAVRSVGAKVLLEDNCAGPFEAATGRCVGSCAISGFQAVGADEDAIALIDSPGSRVERSSVCANSSGNWYGYPRAMRAVRVSGASAGIVVRASTLTEYSYQDSGYAQPPERAVVALAECAGAAPWIADNAAIALTTIHTDGDGVLATGDCHPVIEGNVTVSARQKYAANTRGIQCRAGTVASRCTVAGNDFSNSGRTDYGIHGAIIDFAQTTTGGILVNVYGTGILCEGSSCRDIRNNFVIGQDNNGNCRGMCNLFGTGLALAAGNVDVRDNAIDAGFPVLAQSFVPYAINGTTAGSITANDLRNRVYTRATLFDDNTSTTSVTWAGDGGVVSHNCLKSTSSTPAFGDSGSGHGPQEFTNNHLQATTVLYADGSNQLTTIDQVNALTDMVSSGNDTHCP